MNANDYIVSSIRRYPSLYKDKDLESSKKKVLEHVFFTVGNGLHWGENGEISEDCEEGIPNVDPLPEDYFSKPILKDYRDKGDDEYIEMVNRKCKIIGTVPCDSDFIHEQKSDFPFSVYPICDYSLANKIPENITTDWFEAFKYIVDVAIEYYNTPSLYIRDHYIQFEFFQYNKVDPKDRRDFIMWRECPELIEKMAEWVKTNEYAQKIVNEQLEWLYKFKKHRFSTRRFYLIDQSQIKAKKEIAGRGQK